MINIGTMSGIAFPVACSALLLKCWEG